MVLAGGSFPAQVVFDMEGGLDLLIPGWPYVSFGGGILAVIGLAGILSRFGFW